jgi:hypothetical protein
MVDIICRDCVAREDGGSLGGDVDGRRRAFILIALKFEEVQECDAGKVAARRRR